MSIEVSIVCLLENFECGKRKYCIVLEKVLEKPRIVRHPKLCSNHAPVVDTISASRGYPFKRAFAVIIVEI